TAGAVARALGASGSGRGGDVLDVDGGGPFASRLVSGAAGGQAGNAGDAAHATSGAALTMTDSSNPAWRRKRVLRWSLWSLIRAALIVRRLAWGDRIVAETAAAVVLGLLVVVGALNALFRCPGCGKFF